MLEVPEIGNQPFIFPSQDSRISQLAGNTLPQLAEASDREVLQYPTPNELDEIFASLPIDEILLQISSAPDEGPGFEQHDMMSLPPPQLPD